MFTEDQKLEMYRFYQQEKPTTVWQRVQVTKTVKNSLDDVAEHFGVSRARVHQIFKDIKRKGIV